MGSFFHGFLLASRSRQCLLASLGHPGRRLLFQQLLQVPVSPISVKVLQSQPTGWAVSPLLRFVSSLESRPPLSF